MAREHTGMEDERKLTENSKSQHETGKGLQEVDETNTGCMHIGSQSIQHSEACLRRELRRLGILQMNVTPHIEVVDLRPEVRYCWTSTTNPNAGRERGKNNRKVYWITNTAHSKYMQTPHK